MKSFLFVSIWFGVLGLSLALLEPIPLPVDLQECYETRSFNMTPSFATALHIQNFCLKSYEYKQIAAGRVWSGPNITQEGANYIDSLFRQIFQEAEEVQRIKRNGGRVKRQIRRRYRREVRSPGAFQPFARCIQELQTKASDNYSYTQTFLHYIVFSYGGIFRTRKFFCGKNNVVRKTYYVVHTTYYLLRTTYYLMRTTYYHVRAT